MSIQAQIDQLTDRKNVISKQKELAIARHAQTCNDYDRQNAELDTTIADLQAKLAAQSQQPA